MESQHIKETLRRIIVDVVATDLRVYDVPETNVLAQLHMDSLMVLQAIVLIEQAFVITIEDDTVAMHILDSLDQGVQYIEAARKASSDKASNS
jgi:acyl carrier protein